MAAAENHAAAGSIPTPRASNVLAAVLAARAEVLVVATETAAMTAKDSTSQANRVREAPARGSAVAKEEDKPLSIVYFLLSTNYVQ